MGSLGNYLRNERRTLGSTVTLLRGKRNVRPGAVAMPYVRAQRALLLTFGGISAAESIAYSLARFPTTVHVDGEGPFVLASQENPCRGRIPAFLRRRIPARARRGNECRGGADRTGRVHQAAGETASARVLAFYADDPAAAAEACQEALSRHTSAA